MPGTVSFKFEGGKELEAALKALGPRVARKLAGRALKAGAKLIVDEAKALCPVDPHSEHKMHLRDAITSRVARGALDDERSVLIGVERPESRRFHLVEFGTSKMAAEPFMRPAIDSQAEAAVAEMGRKLGEDIEKEAKALASSPA